MSRTDESVERVLTGLRDASAPAGMGLRVMRAVKEHGVVAGERHGRFAAWRAEWVLLGCVAALIAAAALAPMKRSKTPVQMQADARPANAQLSDRSGRQRPINPAKAPDQILGARTAVRHAVGAESRRLQRTASRPAPPQPVTREERLLLEVAHTGDAQAIELLNPEVQRKQELEAKAEFDRFFGLPERANNQ